MLNKLKAFALLGCILAIPTIAYFDRRYYRYVTAHRTTTVKSINNQPQYFDGDVVEYIITSPEFATSITTTTTLGSIIKSKNSIKIVPLCIRDEDFDTDDISGEPDYSSNSDEICLYEDDEKDIITVSSTSDNINSSSDTSIILQVINDSVYSQRTIEDRVSNPHGEHAEDVWILKASVLRDLISYRRRLLQSSSADSDITKLSPPSTLAKSSAIRIDNNRNETAAVPRYNIILNRGKAH